jgi:hypothetical protein
MRIVTCWSTGWRDGRHAGGSVQLSRLGPEAAESAEVPARGSTPAVGAHCRALGCHHKQHAQLLENLDDDFEAIFGREFLRAYEAQSRADADAGRSWPEPPWPGAR